MASHLLRHHAARVLGALPAGVVVPSSSPLCLSQSALTMRKPFQKRFMPLGCPAGCVVQRASWASSSSSSSSSSSAASSSASQQQSARPDGNDDAASSASSSSSSSSESSSSSSSTNASTSASQSAEFVKNEAKQKAEQAKAAASNFFAKATDFVKTFNQDKAKQLAKFVYEEVKDTFTHESDHAAERAASTPRQTNRDASEVMVSAQNANSSGNSSRNVAGRWMDSAFDRVSSHPTFQRMTERLEDIKENIENSDHPLAHRVRDMNDSLFSETEAARTTRTIRQWDPSFDSVKFLRRLTRELPDIIRAYLRGDKKVLDETCAPQMAERFHGEYMKWQAEGLEMDDNILDVEDVELIELKLMGDAPTAVVRFTAQQINCVRSKKTGEVERGAPDDVHSVHYLAAMELQEGAVDEDGTYTPPRWLLREMAVHGMQAIY